MSRLEYPKDVVALLQEAVERLSQAHLKAGEVEDGQTNLNGPVRDAIFGLNTAVEALIALIEDCDCQCHENGGPVSQCCTNPERFWPDHGGAGDG